MEITRKAYAKINLFLDITGRRADGYHTITGIMQAVSLHDVVTVTLEEPRTGGGAEALVLTCSEPTLPTDRRNLAWRAAEAFFAAAGLGCRRLAIDIDKHIPAAAGLAGGSTDAAAVLAALNQGYGYPLAPEALSAVGLTLGADVPFCLAGGAMRTEGIGELLTPVTPLPDCALLIACAGEGVSTPAAYRALDETYACFASEAYAPHWIERNRLEAALATGHLPDICSGTFNLFEEVILPEREVARTIKATLREAGAMTALMSGSGPSVFGVFPADDHRATGAAERLRARGIPVWVCRPVTKDA